MKISGLARCTGKIPALEKLVSNKTLGPDNGWVLLSAIDLQAFCQGEGQALVHRGRKEYEHVCAFHGGWAFDAQDASYIRDVVFLHYKTPKKAAAFLGEVDDGAGTKVFKFSGDQLWETYRALAQQEGEVHVWKRASHGEIAIDFCMTVDGLRTMSNHPRLNLPTFV